MKNVHLIPTEKPSRLSILSSGKLNFGAEVISSSNSSPQHLYITCEEKIKEEDWILNTNTNSIAKYTGHGSMDWWVKIILTTDQELIADGVQEIDEEYLEWFVKNPSCESLEVEKTFVTNSGLGYQEYATLDSNFKVIEINAKIPQTSYYLGKVTILNTYEYVINYKIIIPKEEPKQELEKELFELEQELDIPSSMRWHNSKAKQESIEKAAENYVRNESDATLKLISKYSFKDGAKWQAERMYSEEEVLEVFHKFSEYLPLHYEFLVKEQLKKK
jgi:hypothetical protein